MTSPEFAYQPAEEILEEGLTKTPDCLSGPSRNHFVFLAYLLDGNPLEERITVCESEEFFITRFTQKGAVEEKLGDKDLDELMKAAKKLSGQQPKNTSHAINLIEQVLANSEVISLNLPRKDNWPQELGDNIEDRGINTIEKLVETNTTAGVVRDAMNCLGDREKAVIKMRFGIDCDPHTLEEVGRYFGFTRERARQIEAKALIKLRHSSDGNKLRDCLE